MRKDAFYFPHDSNAKDDPKIVLLIEQLGLEGYGIYWVLVETLRDQPEYKYPLNLLPAIARRYATTKDKVEIVVMNYHLFSITEDQQFFLSQSLCRRMEQYELTKQKRIMAGKIGRQKQLEYQASMGNRQVNAEQTPAITGLREEKRREESKRKDKLHCAKNAQVDEQKPEVNKFDLFWKSYPKKRSKGDALKAWKQVKGDSILDAILKSVESFKAIDPQWAKEGGQFVPYPASWLRAHGWEDEIGVGIATPEVIRCHDCDNERNPNCINRTDEQRLKCTYFEKATVKA
jgi:hypothetical protein